MPPRLRRGPLARSGHPRLHHPLRCPHGRGADGSRLRLRVGWLGALALLAAALLLGLSSPDGNFNVLALADLAQRGGISRSLQQIVFGLLFVSCAVRLPMVPLHGWLPAVQRHLPAEFAAFVQGAFLASGAYGLLRLAWTIIFPRHTR